MSVLPRRSVLLAACVSLLVSLAMLLGVVAPRASAAPAAPRPTHLAGINDPLLQADSVQPQGKRITIGLRAGADEIVSVAARGFVRQGGRDYPLDRATATIAGGKAATMHLRPRKGWQERRIRSALSKGRTLTATIHVRFKDILGHVSSRSKTIKLT